MTWSATAVYPRVGGETEYCADLAGVHGGLSPRGRGNPGRAADAVLEHWSIPAWAGKPPSAPSARARIRVYPRVGGETGGDDGDAEERAGLSPRGRGNLDVTYQDVAAKRSIPAWAGKPAAEDEEGADARVYPRVGGETTLRSRRRAAAAGLSPRGRGNHGRRCTG